MTKPNALIAVIFILALAVSVLVARRQPPAVSTICDGAEINALLAADYRKLIPQHHDALLNDPASPIVGNPQGDIVLVFFLDYNCSHCRQTDLFLQQAVKDDPNLKIVHKQLPGMTPGSAFAARAAFASRKQGKYEEFNRALFAFPGLLDARTTLIVAAHAGLNVEQLKWDMRDLAITDAIARNRALAHGLYIDGTPALVVGDEVTVGVVEMAKLQRCIADLRAKAKAQSL